MDALRHGNLRLATLLSVICLGLAVAGCSGDDGDDGAPGPAGAAGQDGVACWDLNENGVGDFVLPDAPFTEDLNGDGLFNTYDCNAAAGGGPQTNPVETCAVCHGSGSIADAEVAHTLPPIEAVSNVTFATVNGGADLAVTFDLAVDGAPATGYDTVRRAYFNNGGTRTDLRVDGSLEGIATLTDNGDGNYTITVAGAGPEAANNNRWLFQVLVDDDRETRAYFYADFPASPFPPEVSPVQVTAQACEACHGPEGIQVHGGGFAASDGAEPCLTCHGSDESDDPEVVPALVEVVHEYHSGIWEEFDREGNFIGFAEVTYPTYMNNCSVCHETEDQLITVNAMPVIADACFTCHGSTATMFAPDDPLYTSLHEGLTGGCETCHAGQIPTAPQTVAEMHNGSTTERGGVIWEGVDTSVTEGAKIAWTITDVADDGTNLTITWQATFTEGGVTTAVDPCNATPAAGEPAFFAIPPLTLPDGREQNRNNLSILRNYAQGQDFILGTNPEAAGQPGSSPAVNDTNTTCSGNVATTVVPVEETDAMYGRVAIQGKPWVVAVDPDDADGVMQVRAKTPTFDWVVGVGGEAPKRRLVVDTTQCLNCHVGSLYQHGGNRVDNVDMCLLCHNTAANDQYVRVDGFGVDASEAYDSRAGQGFGMREMLHAVHSAGVTGAPIVIYRGRGIYAWAGSEDLLNNWPTGANCTDSNDRTGANYFTVAGSDPEADDDPCQPHNFHTPTYPRGIYDCAACHYENFAVLPDPTKAMASTVDTGAPPFGEQVNDVLEGITASSCMTCHRSDVPSEENGLKAHAYQNGWVPQEFEEGRQTIIEANQ